MNKLPGLLRIETRKGGWSTKEGHGAVEGSPMKYRIRLAALLLAGILAAFTAQAQAGYVSVFTAGGDRNILSVAVSGEELYFLYDDKVYALAKEGEAPREVMEAKGYEALISGGENIFGVTFNGQVFPLRKSDEGSLASLDALALDLPSFENSVYLGGAADESRLFLLYGEGDMGVYEAELLVYDLSQDKRTSIHTNNVYEICGYKKDKLLVLTEDQADGEKSKLLLLDPATGGREPFLDLPPGRASGLAYDAAADTVCCAAGTLAFSSVASGPFEASGILPEDVYPISDIALFQGAYAVSNFSTLFLCDTQLDIESLPALSIYGNTSQEAKQAFKAAYPGVVVREEPFDMWRDDLAASLITQSSQADIYVIPLARNVFLPLKEKGLYVDLTDDARLVAQMAKMLPKLTNVFWQEGRLCAFPLHAQSEAALPRYNKTLWEELGFSQEDLPRTMPEFIDFTARWMQEYAAQYPDIVPFQPTFSAKWQLHRWTIYHYMLALEPEGEEPYFDVPLLGSILNKLDAAAPMLEELDRQCEASFTGEQETDPAVLFDFYGDLLAPKDAFADWQPWLLTLGGEDSPQLTVMMNALVINPNSKNKEMALAFAACAAGALDAKTKALLYADETAPVESPGFVRTREQYQADKERLEGAMDAAAPDEKKELGEELASVEESYAWMEETTRWEVSPETILRYKELVPYLRAYGEERLLFDVFDASEALAGQYDGGQLTAQGYLKELERIYRMRRAE